MSTIVGKIRPLKNTQADILRMTNWGSVVREDWIVFRLWPMTRRFSTKVETVRKHMRVLVAAGHFVPGSRRGEWIRTTPKEKA